MVSSIVRIKENFLPASYHQEVTGIITGNSFPWLYSDFITGGSREIKEKFSTHDTRITDVAGLVHTFFNAMKGTRSDFFYLVDPFKYFIEDRYNIVIAEWLRIRATTVLSSHTPGMLTIPHIDNTKKHCTLIFYLTDNEESTVWFDETFNGIMDYKPKTIIEEIKPKKGTAVLFDGLRYHAGRTTENKKILINFNFTSK
jgi:hypothetical protein